VLGGRDGHGGEVEDLVEYVVEFLDCALRRECVAAEDVTTEWLDKARDGTVGMVHLTLARKALFNLVVGWVDDLKTVVASTNVVNELVEALHHFADYRRYCAKFCDYREAGGRWPPDASQGGEDGDPAASLGVDGDDQEPLEVVKNMFKNCASHAVLHFFDDLMATAHDKVIAKALRI
jgi:hypothetical protein